MESILLLGIGGHAHSIVDSIESSNEYSICGFLDVPGKIGEQYRGYEVIGTNDLLEDFFQQGIRNAVVSIGYLGTVVEHDCSVRDFSHVSVGSVLCGDVYVGQSSFIGANAIVIQGKNIGDNCIVGAGTTIRKNLEEYAA